MTRSKFSLKRHVERKHSKSPNDAISDTSLNITLDEEQLQIQNNAAVEMRLRLNDTRSVKKFPGKTETPKVFSCKLCNSVFTSKYALTRHMKIRHDPIELFNTDHENESINGANVESLIDLKMDDDDASSPVKRNRTFSCSTCRVKFTRRDTLRVHMQTVHNRVRAFKCQVIDSSN